MSVKLEYPVPVEHPHYVFITDKRLKTSFLNTRPKKACIIARFVYTEKYIFTEPVRFSSGNAFMGFQAYLLRKLLRFFVKITKKM